MKSRLSFNFSILVLIFESTLAVVVNLTDGPIRGYTIRSGEVETNVFKAIPFARPPLGDLRFRPPHPPDKWTQVRDATRYARPCMSIPVWTTVVLNNTSEDCLYLNVWADARCSANSPCPIVCLIHGGLFESDSATIFNETHLINSFASDRLIFVIPAYRIGTFGFLDLGAEIDEAPYNIGIYDMIAALEWTKRELPKFGGDVNQVTIFGYSADASAVEFLMSSPEVDENLFSRALITGGCPELHQHFSRSLTEAVVDVVGCNETSDIREQLECLRSIPADLLSDTSKLTNPSAWTNVGPQSDSVLFPSSSFAGLRSYWKPKPVMLIATRREMPEIEKRPLAHVCVHYLSSLGYFRAETLNECIRYYSAINDWRLVLYRDIIHTSNILLAQWNTRKQAPSYVGIFGMKNHDVHTGDLVYMIGYHQDRFNFTADDVWMEKFYVEAVKRFMRGGKPTDDVDGRGYLYIEYESASTNQTELRPRFLSDQIFNQPAVDFWLHDLAAIDAYYSSGQSKLKRRSFHTDSIESPEVVSARRKAGDSLSALSSWTPNENLKRLNLLRRVPLSLRVWHPLHNTFLVILTMCVSICALAVVVIAVDAFRSGTFKRRRGCARSTRIEMGEEATDENSVLLDAPSGRDYGRL